MYPEGGFIITTPERRVNWTDPPSPRRILAFDACLTFPMPERKMVGLRKI